MTGTTTPLSVLLVDDESGIRMVLGTLIEDFGYRVHCAETAEAALACCEQESFPLVVSDIRMPGMGGIAFLRTVRERWPETQVIMITGHGDMDNTVLCLRLGAVDFITKPVNADLLEHALQRCAETCRLHEALALHTRHLEELVAARTRELLDVHRVAAVGEAVANMAHGIKNSAAALEGSLYVIENGLQQGRLQQLETGWSMLRNDIATVRDQLLSLLTSGNSPKQQQEVLDPLLPAQHSVASLQGRAMSLAVGLHLAPVVAALPSLVRLDRSRVASCLSNLVNNALEAFPPLGQREGDANVTVAVTRRDNMLVYTVEDNGLGLSVEASQRLQEGLFTTKPDGTGFGLLGTRRTVLEMDGQLTWTSVPGVRTQFCMEIPLLPVEK
ncbi:MAG: response regulator [Bilophila sp.]